MHPLYDPIEVSSILPTGDHHSNNRQSLRRLRLVSCRRTWGLGMASLKATCLDTFRSSAVTRPSVAWVDGTSRQGGQATRGDTGYKRGRTWITESIEARLHHPEDYLAQHYGAHPSFPYSVHNTDRRNSHSHPVMPSSAQVRVVAIASALLIGGVPRPQCDVEETSGYLGDTEYFKKIKLTDCEQEDCPSSVAYVPPRG
jgi:hypothetical protein